MFFYPSFIVKMVKFFLAMTGSETFSGNLGLNRELKKKFNSSKIVTVCRRLCL